MKLSDLRPCDKCGARMSGPFYVIRVSQAMVMPSAQQQVGLALMLGSLALAEAMGPDPDVVKVFGDENPALMTELHLCQECFLLEDVPAAELMEKASRAEAAPAEDAS